MQYVYITTSWRQLRCYELLLTFSQFTLVFCAINVTDCMIYDIDVESCFCSMSVKMNLSPDACAELPWRQVVDCKGSVRRLYFPRNAAARVHCSLKALTSHRSRTVSRFVKHLEWKTVWRMGRRVKVSVCVIGTVWHYRMSRGVWRDAALSATRQFASLAHQASVRMLGNER